MRRDGAEILLRVELDDDFPPTGFTRHYYGLPPNLTSGVGTREVVPPPVALEIAAYEDEASGVYLFYLDGADEVLTDTWHATVQDAQEQAYREFLVPPDRWSDIGLNAPERQVP